MAPDSVFFDGDCVLCQNSVLFLIRRDPDGTRFRFGAQGGESFSRMVPEEFRVPGEGSIVVVTASGEYKVRSGAVVHLLGRLGGLWAVLGAALWAVPRPVRDFGYRIVARARDRFFRRRETSACGLIPSSIRSRFLP